MIGTTRTEPRPTATNSRDHLQFQRTKARDMRLFGLVMPVASQVFSVLSQFGPLILPWKTVFLPS